MKREFWIPMDNPPPKEAELLCRDAGGWWFDDGSEDGWLMPPPHWPGDVVRLSEEWRILCWEPGDSMDNWSGFVEYRDGDRQFEYIPNDWELWLEKNTGAWQPAATMPAWAMRSYTVQSITPERRELWAWRCVGELICQG